MFKRHAICSEDSGRGLKFLALLLSSWFTRFIITVAQWGWVGVLYNDAALSYVTQHVISPVHVIELFFYVLDTWDWEMVF